MKISDVKLDDKDMESIDAEIEKYNQQVYKGTMSAHSKGVLRDKMKRDEKFNIWEARDYVYGQDEGEPYKGDVKE